MQVTVINRSAQASRTIVIVAEGVGRFVDVQTRSANGPQVVAWMTRFDRWIGIVLDRDVLPGHRVELQIDRGPQGVTGLIEAHIRTAADPLVPRVPFAQRASVGVAPAASVGTATSDLRQTLRRLEVHSIDAALVPKQSQQALMFWWLDSHTQPRFMRDRAKLLTWPERLSMIEVRYRADCIAKLSLELSQRAQRRQELMRKGVASAAEVAAAMRAVPVSRPAAAYMAELLRRLFAGLDPGCARAGRAEEDVSEDLVADAMAAFASGELWLDTHLPPDIASDSHLTECAPDSPFFFLFAEIALVAARLGNDGGFWAKQLPGLIAAQRCFRLSYGDPDRPRSRDEIIRATKVPVRVQVPPEERSKELSRLRGLSLDALEFEMSKNLHTTLSSSFLVRGA